MYRTSARTVPPPPDRLFKTVGLLVMSCQIVVLIGGCCLSNVPDIDGSEFPRVPTEYGAAAVLALSVGMLIACAVKLTRKQSPDTATSLFVVNAGWTTLAAWLLVYSLGERAAYNARLAARNARYEAHMRASAALFREVFPRCEAGDLRACERLAGLYDPAVDIHHRSERKLRALDRGCSLGSAGSCDGAADMLADDLPRRRALYRRACELDATQCHGYGYMLMRGEGGPSDCAGARAAFERSCPHRTSLECEVLVGNELADLCARMAPPRDQ